MRVELKVSGMHCNHCVDKITRFVSEISGVGEVCVDLEAQVVRVDYESQTTLEAIKEAILDSGFEVE
ncbi:heavy-metal-associated domain-containing protein [Helicobacter sp. 23-1045]